jgi:hypothetical protein
MWSRYGHYLFVRHLVRHRFESWLHIYVLTLHLIIAAKSLSPPPTSQVPTPPRKPQPPYNFFRDKLSTIHTIAAYLLYSNEIDKAVLFLGRCAFYTHIPQPSVFFCCACKKHAPLTPIISKLVVGAPSFGLVN